MRLLVDQPGLVREWVAVHIPNCSRGWPNDYAIGVVNDNNELIGGSVYHDWSPEYEVIEMSSAAITPKWITRSTLKGLFQYPFGFLKCRMVVMRVSSKNGVMRDIAKRLGCSEYVIKDLRAAGEDECVYTLARADWLKFIGEPDGQSQRTTGT